MPCVVRPFPGPLLSRLAALLRRSWLSAAPGTRTQHGGCRKGGFRALVCHVKSYIHEKALFYLRKEHVGFREIQKDEFAHAAVGGEGSPYNEGLMAPVSPQPGAGVDRCSSSLSITWLCLRGRGTVCVPLAPWRRLVALSQIALRFGVLFQ